MSEQVYEFEKFPKVAPPQFFNLDVEQVIEKKLEDIKLDIDLDTLLTDSETPYYQSNLDQPRKSAKKVRLAYYLGSRGGGKTTAMEEDAEDYYNEGMSCWWLWGSRSNENVFIGVNRNCKLKWSKTFETLDKEITLSKTVEHRQKLYDLKEKLHDRLHCNCSKSYPISWLTPNYYTFKGVDEYNNNWSGKDEFDSAFVDGWITRSYNELSKTEKLQLVQRKLKKPKHLIKTDTIRICPFTVPNNAKNKEIFEREFIKYALEARKEHRWIVMNPLMFLDESDKFQTMGYIMSRIKVWVDLYFQPNTPESVAKLRGLSEPVPKEQWTKVERSWDKICMILAEIRTIAPPHKFSPEQKSNLSKRPIIDMIPELRHFRVWLLGDLQSPDDLNDSVRPMADHVVIKRASKEVLGDDWSSFYNMIEKSRNERVYAMSHGRFDDIKKAPSDLVSIINKNLPSIPEIPRHKGYVVYTNGEFYLETFGSASFHHKKESETLQSITNITWKVKDDMVQKATSIPGSLEESEVSSEKRLKSYDEDLVKMWCVKEFIRTKSWPQVVTNLDLKVKSSDEKDRLPNTSYSGKEHKLLSNKIRKDKKVVEIIDFAKNHKEMTPDEVFSSLKI